MHKTTGLLLFLSAVAVAAANQEAFKISEETRIPGTTLAPGTYTIALVDRLTDRGIVSVRNADGKVLSTFLGVWKPISGGRGVAREDGVLRTWSLSNTHSLEFVYPKDEAVAIAKLTGRAVLAVDPESEQMQPSNLSRRDMEIVTLWTLTPTPVSGGSPTIAAAKYGAPPPPKPAPPARMPATASQETALALLGGLLLAAVPLRRAVCRP